MPLPVGRPGDAPLRTGIADFVDAVVVVGIAGLHRRMQTANNITDGLRVFLYPLSGPQAGELATDVIMFNSRVVGRLRDVPPGTVVPGLVTQGQGRNAPVDFEPLSQQWEEYANSQIVAQDQLLTRALYEERERFNQFEMNRRDGGTPIAETRAAMPSMPTSSAPTVPNAPPPMSGAGSVPPAQPAPNGPPAVSPSAGPPMPALPSQNLQASIATQNQEPPF